MENLLRVSKIGPYTLPVAKSTLYKWKHIRKFPKLFVKLGSALFVDLDVLQKIVEEGRGR